jgi:cytochrome c oxidase subunit II
MSISNPPAGWFKAPTGNERLWVGLALVWCIVMFLVMPYWHFFGKQNSTGESYRVTPEAFEARAKLFVDNHTVGELNGMPIVEPPPGSDAYLVAKMWSWYPVLQLKKGQTYRIHLSSTDLQHGFSLQPMNMNFTVLPGYDHVLTLTPTSTGEFPIVCNEFCGIGHHMMVGRMLVVE